MVPAGWRDGRLSCRRRRLRPTHSTLVEYERGHRLALLDVLEAYEAYEAELGVARGKLVALHEQARLELYGEDRSHRKTYVLRPALQTRNQLPTYTPHFVGRAEELRQLTALLDSTTQASRPVVISAINGTAGIGKTALAVHWAHHVSQRFPDGQLYVNLRGFDPTGTPMQPAEAIRGFLHAFQIPPDRIPVDLDARQRCTAACWPTEEYWCWTTPATVIRSAPCCRAAPPAGS